MHRHCRALCTACANHAVRLYPVFLLLPSRRETRFGRPRSAVASSHLVPLHPCTLQVSTRVRPCRYSPHTPRMQRRLATSASLPPHADLRSRPHVFLLTQVARAPLRGAGTPRPRRAGSPRALEPRPTPPGSGDPEARSKSHASPPEHCSLCTRSRRDATRLRAAHGRPFEHEVELVSAGRAVVRRAPACGLHREQHLLHDEPLP